MFNLADTKDTKDEMEFIDPPVVFSSFQPVSPAFTPYKSWPADPFQTLTEANDSVGIVCAELPKKMHLGKAIWHSKKESPEDFWDRDYEVKEAPCNPQIDKEGDIPSPSWSPVSPSLPTQNAFAAQSFYTPQLSEPQRSILADDHVSESLLNAWLGTNVSFKAEWTIKPSKTLLEDAMSRRAAIEATTYKNPYDPEGWLQLTHIYFELCFNDLQVASAHKAIYLASQGLDLTDYNYGKKARDVVAMRLSCSLGIVVIDELESCLIEAYKALLWGLFEMDAYWDGLKEAKRALEIFPGHADLLILQTKMKDEFEARAKVLQESKHSDEDIKDLSRAGRSFKRKYPWLQEQFFIRSQPFLAEINKTFNSTNCEVRALFGTQDDPSTQKPRRSHRIAGKASMQHPKASSVEQGYNVGPLGVFAKRTIHKDEIILIDHNLTIVPAKPSKKLLHCDACNALLIPPFLPAGELVRATCCPKVAFCSQKCASAALDGYHKVICSQDFKWLSTSTSSKDLDVSWQPRALLRLLAIIVTDLKAAPDAKMHPLQHPLLVRLTAGYEHDPTRATPQIWNYFSHVVAPTRILAQLGIDFFADARWSAEVIHCVSWRIFNNACRTSSCTVVGEKLDRVVLSGLAPGYIFFNHSCEASVGWMAGGSVEGVARIGLSEEGVAAGDTACAAGSALGKRRRGGEERQMVEEEDEVKVGSNALLCVATRDIKEGEEVRVSYLPPGKRQQLGRWFEDGRCLCGVCNGELTDRN